MKLDEFQLLEMSKQHNMLTLASSPDNVANVEPYVEKLVAKYQISPDVYGNILISLTEAVTNAITHGNNNDVSKLVMVNLKMQKDKLAFFITDEGDGFDFANLPDPTAPENLLKIGGRGVFLMRQLSDKVMFSNNGSTVEIYFNI